jgi:hypothetical protein
MKMEPSEKSHSLERLIDAFSNDFLCGPRTASIRLGACVTCGGKALEFKDKLSEKEYGISGMCQVCQDKTFGG